ncbi:MAG: hypothetical protein WBI81_11195 [Limnochordia bacterium]
MYLALKEIAGAHGLDALALKCFDLLPVLQNTACFALAKLSKDGIVAACEGDIIHADRLRNYAQLFLSTNPGQMR